MDTKIEKRKPKNYRIMKCADCSYWCEECKEINMTKNNGHGNAHQKGESLCWCCKHAVPNADMSRGCNWSLRRRPVPGWKAEKVRLSEQDGMNTISYIVETCPKFERG